MHNRAPVTEGGLAAGIRCVLSPHGLRGTLLECAWVAARVATYPMGLLHSGELRGTDRLNLDGLGPLQRSLLVGDIEAAGTPILLVHGIVDNHSTFAVLRRALRRCGFGRVTSVNYGWLGHDVRSLAAQLGRRVEQLCDETGYERLHVVGHSLGGLIARYYIQRLGGDARVHTLVTLGSPHHGTRWAEAVPHRLVRQLRPGSDLFNELDEPCSGCHTRFVSFWSDLDQVIIPQRNAKLGHPDLHTRNIFVRGVGHLSLPAHRGVVSDICRTLARLDHQATVDDVLAEPDSGVTGARDAQAKAPQRSPRTSSP